MRACEDEPASPDPWCPIERWEPWPHQLAGVTLTDGPVSTLLSAEDQAHIGAGMPTSRPVGFVRNV